jgi:TRAP-type mannitol/chloroaromatic compound transport system permease small subunit
MSPAAEPLPLRALDSATQGLNIAGSALILGLMALIGLDVAGRNLFGAPISGVPEIVSLSIVAIVFLQIPQALRAGRMTRSEGVLALLHAQVPRLARTLETVFDLAGASIVSVIVWATWPLFTRALERGDFVGAVGDFTAPTWPVKGIIVLGGGMLTLQFLARIVRRHRGL